MSNVILFDPAREADPAGCDDLFPILRRLSLAGLRIPDSDLPGTTESPGGGLLHTCKFVEISGAHDKNVGLSIGERRPCSRLGVWKANEIREISENGLAGLLWHCYCTIRGAKNETGKKAATSGQACRST